MKTPTCSDNATPLDSQRTILSFVADLPNVCSLIGLLCTVLAIYFAAIGMFHASMIGLIWAVWFDWSDGIIARKMKNRTEVEGHFGAQLDSLIDIVSFGVCPAIILLSYGSFSVWYIPGAFVIIAAVAVRLSYFNIFGLVDKSSYIGMAVDNNGIIIVFAFLFNGVFSHNTFSVILYILILLLALLNVAPIKTPKFSGHWYYVLILYVMVTTTILGWQWYHT